MIYEFGPDEKLLSRSAAARSTASANPFILLAV